MRVKYIKIDSPENVSYKINWQRPFSDFPLIQGKNYTVYAIEYTDERKINFFLLDEGGNIYPSNYPSEFFEISDPRMSKYWERTNDNQLYPIQNPIYPNIITFKEWKINKYFEEDMFKGINGANDIFQSYKKLIDNEYPDESLDSAIIMEENWILCPICNNAFENLSREGIISCANCKARLNNPCWID
ncbi:hypothetical protein MP477_10055 [Chryseobacterium sp. WG23]|uniref:hypothetical protein n=1 Tax=Chryseobacterium sp. WG23 TaxID=2926910 RepID=UPI00211E686F|nr:hypothetical protein [Chryseobacterium sp. WG23]MCQ9635296.1 hypothetical protein [Chryseobacterium sp. WG23]